jgi:hypothetical protein
MVQAMTFLQGAVAAVAFVGLTRRGRLRLGWSFALYLVSITIFNTLMGLWPGRFLNWPTWLFRELTYAGLKVALAIELSGLLFRAFPSARQTARTGLLAIFSVSAAWIAMASPGSLGEWIRLGVPRIKCGEAFLLAWLLMVVLWYRIPLHSHHKAILMAFAPYLLVFTVFLQALETYGWTGTSDVNYLNMLVFLGVLIYWLIVAWRPEEVSEVHPSVAKTVQPWA